MKNNIATGLVNLINTYETRGFGVTEVPGDTPFDLDNVKNQYNQR